MRKLILLENQVSRPCIYINTASVFRYEYIFDATASNIHEEDQAFFALKYRSQFLQYTFIDIFESSYCFS